MGELHRQVSVRRAEDLSAPSNAIVFPAYDTEIDPLFASGYELACRGADELAALLTAGRVEPRSQPQRIATWRAGFDETERGVRQLVRYYYSCPPIGDRSPARADHVLRESSPDFA